MLPRIVRLWWPLAGSWLLMGLEMPLYAAVVGRMADENVNLAAYSSVVMPLSLVIEAPIIMMLAASTALSKDWASYRALRRFTWVAGASLTALHVVVAFTPLYDVVAGDLLRARPEVLEPARLGLRIMTPWSGAIALRRFQQGVLIRFEQSRAVVHGTVVRLLSNASVLSLGLWVGGVAGIVVGTAGIATGVLAEAAYIGWRVRPVVRERLVGAPRVEPRLDRRSFLRFYVPLAITPLMTLSIQPIGAAAMNRMPESLASLAAWPAVYGLVFVLRSFGFAYNEVVVTLCDEPGAGPSLRRFALGLAVVTSVVLAVLGLSPLGHWWFATVSDLEPEVAALAATALGVAVLMPAYSALQNWFQGRLVHARRTRAVTEAVVLYFTITVVCLAVAVHWSPVAGIYLALGSFTIAGLAQTLWLAHRARGA